jgi:MFS family permease
LKAQGIWKQGIWKNVNFTKLWFSQAVSLLGTSITTLAIPLLAAISLHASPVQMGLLNGAAFAPFLLFGLFAGIWVDQLPRRATLVMTDIARAAILMLVPILFYANVLDVYALVVVQFLCGILNLISDVGHQSFLPSLVGRDDLVESNGKLEIARSVTFVAGPSVAGGLVAIVGAPIAIIADIFSFIVSAAFISRINVNAAETKAVRVAGSVWRQVGEGVSYIFHNDYLRAIALKTGMANFSDRVMQAVYILFLTNVLKLDSVTVGFLFSTIGIGAFLGALSAARLSRLVGLGPAIVIASLLGGVASLFFPAASVVPALTIPALLVGHFFLGMSHPLYNVNQISLRQAITPQMYQGRMNSTMRFFVWGTIPLGSLLGGFLGEAVGIQSTLLIGALGVLAATVWIVISPIRSLQKIPDLAPAGAVS